MSQNIWETLKETMDKEGIDHIRPACVIPNSFEEAFSYFEDIAYLYEKMNNVTNATNEVWYPTVNPNTGFISWNKDATDNNPSPVNIMGPRGQQGVQGDPGPRGNDGRQGDPGPRGNDGVNGQPGFSPVVNVTSIQGGHRVDITDETHTDSFNVMDGTPGADNTNVWYPTVTENGIISWEKSNSASVPMSMNIMGPQGIQGNQGEPGPRGNDGTNGVDGVNGTNGTNGTNGQDGFSPTVSILPIDGGNRITIIDRDGGHTFNVMDGVNGTNGVDGVNGTNGTNGTNGQDGFSPVVTVTLGNDGTRDYNQVSIQSATGTNTFNVYDGVNGTNGRDGVNGTNGRDGVNGQDGFSPVVTVTHGNDGTRDYNQVSIQSATGTNTFNVYDGVNGAGGGSSVEPVYLIMRYTTVGDLISKSMVYENNTAASGDLPGLQWSWSSPRTFNARNAFEMGYRQFTIQGAGMSASDFKGSVTGPIKPLLKTYGNVTFTGFNNSGSPHPYRVLSEDGNIAKVTELDTATGLNMMYVRLS